jgi:hypothetical protein
VKALIKAVNYCVKASDCVVSDFHPGCPFGCYILTNRNASLDRITGRSALYQSSCPVCKYECMAPPSEGDIDCIADKCVDLRYSPATQPPVATTTTLIRLNDEECRRMRYDVLSLLGKANYCQTDNDCVVPALGLGCPFGCYFVMNRNASLSGDVVNAMVKAGYDYHRACPVCEQICLSPPGVEDLKCRYGKCADRRFDLQPDSNWTFRLDINDSLPKTLVVYNNGTVSLTESKTARTSVIAPERMQALKQTAIDSGFFNMRGDYGLYDCCDLIAHTITISSGGRTVRVYCYNDCPAGFLALKDALKQSWPEDIVYYGFA